MRLPGLLAWCNGGGVVLTSLAADKLQAPPLGACGGCFAPALPVAHGAQYYKMCAVNGMCARLSVKQAPGQDSVAADGSHKYTQVFILAPHLLCCLKPLFPCSRLQFWLSCGSVCLEEQGVHC